MSQYRAMLEKATLRGLCWFTSLQSSIPVQAGLFHAKVLTGPIRGTYFTMPQLERVSFALGTYEQHITQTMASFVSPGMIAYDVGANAGYLTLVLATLVGPQGRVFAFEPDSKNFTALRANIEANGVTNTTPVPKAVSDMTGIITFASFNYSLVGHIAHDDTPSDATLSQVEAVSLDDFVFRDGHQAPQFVKIDVEGAEEKVLRGASRLLHEIQPIILCEVRGDQIWQRTCHFMTQHGYRFQLLEGGWEMDKNNLGDVLFLPNEDAP